MISASALHSDLYLTDGLGLYRVVAVLGEDRIRVENCWTCKESTKKAKELEEMRPVRRLVSEAA